MAIQIFGHAKCKATRAATRFFAERGVKVQSIDIVQKGMSKGELLSVARAVGGVSKLFDREGTRVRERGLQHAAPGEERMIELLLEDGKLYRTPVVRNGQQATVGLDEAAWKSWVEVLKKS